MGDYDPTRVSEYLSSPHAALEDYGNDCNAVIFLVNAAGQDAARAKKILDDLSQQNGGKLLKTLAEAKPQVIVKIKEKYPQESTEIDDLVAKVNQLYQEENLNIPEILKHMRRILEIIKGTK